MDSPRDPELRGQSTLQRIEDMMTQADKIIPHWPRLYRDTFGSRIYDLLIEMEMLCVEAHKKYHKKTTLQTLDIRNEQLRLLLRRASRTAYEDRKGNQKFLLRPGGYEYFVGMISVTGKLIGGWIKSTANSGSGKTSGD